MMAEYYNSDIAMLEPSLKNIDMVKYGGALLEHAITIGNEDLIDLLIKYGADIKSPPSFIKSKPEYKCTEFSITAAIAGDFKIF